MSLFALNAATDHAHGAGDSIMVGQGNTPTPGGYLFPVAQRIWTQQLADGAPVGGWKPGPPGPGHTFVPTLMAFTQNGISGSTIADLNTDKVTRIGAYNPTKLFIGVSPNDFGSTATWAASASSILTYWTGTLGRTAADLAIISCVLGFGCKWQSGVAAWGLNTSDSSVLAINNVASSWCVSNGVYYMDIRGTTTADADTMASYLSTHNTPEPGITDYEVCNPSSQIHPSITLGQKVCANMIWAHLAVTY